jgi:hypothetical protein
MYDQVKEPEVIFRERERERKTISRREKELMEVLVPQRTCFEKVRRTTQGWTCRGESKAINIFFLI